MHGIGHAGEKRQEKFRAVSQGTGAEGTRTGTRTGMRTGSCPVCSQYPCLQRPGKQESLTLGAASAGAPVGREVRAQVPAHKSAWCAGNTNGSQPAKLPPLHERVKVCEHRSTRSTTGYSHADEGGSAAPPDCRGCPGSYSSQSHRRRLETVATGAVLTSQRSQSIVDHAGERRAAAADPQVSCLRRQPPSIASHIRCGKITALVFGV